MSKLKEKNRSKVQNQIQQVNTLPSSNNSVQVQLNDIQSNLQINQYSQVQITNVQTITSKIVDTDFYALIDVSGSMSGSKLDNAKQAVSHFFSLMKESDRFAIVTFDSKAFFKLKPRPVGQLRRNNELPGTLSKIFAQGGTALYDAIYMTIEQIRNKNNRTVISVLTDGDDNMSFHTMAEVNQLLEQYPEIRLSIAHITDSGTSNLNYETLCRNRGKYEIISEVNLIVKKIVQVYESDYNSY